MSREISRTILQQIGGSARLRAMIGAHSFTNDASGSVMFQWKSKSLNGYNHIKISLNSMDMYEVVFRKIGRAPNFKITSSKTFTVYGDGLVDLFESQTGNYLTF